ncbi:hypothetical protein MKW92_042738 [Papaver armeniacum]|nr:hypothetical protein MKW92_042738 [Papaver armeniacum]
MQQRPYQRIRNVVANQNSRIQLAPRQKLLDVLLVRTHFCQLCVNNAVRSINHFKVSPGDVVSFQENEVVSEEIRRSLFASYSILWNQSRMVMPSQNQGGQPYTNEIRFLRDLHSTMQEANIVISKMTGSAANSHLYNFTWWVLNLAQYMTIPK